jgi:hypothetical protein
VLHNDLQQWLALYEQQPNSSSSVKLLKVVMGKLRTTIYHERVHFASVSVEECKRVIASWQEKAAECADRAQRKLQQVRRTLLWNLTSYT